MPSRSAQAESFSLANMVPQVHASNAGVWEGMEAAARQMALDEGEVYVVSGPAFIGNDLKRIGNVLLPTHFWKVLYSPAQQRAGAYVTPNDDSGAYSMVSVSELEKMVGVSALPGVPRSIRGSAMALPKPTAQHGGKKSRTKANTRTDATSEPEDDFTLRDFATSILNALSAPANSTERNPIHEPSIQALRQRSRCASHWGDGDREPPGPRHSHGRRGAHP